MTDATMTDAATIATNYLAVWNETNATRRRAMLDQNWTEDATYVDPLAQVAGRDQIDALIAGVQERFPGCRFTLIGKPDGYGGHAPFSHVRFSWALGPEGQEGTIKGSDVAVADRGRVRAVIGFLDQVPKGI